MNKKGGIGGLARAASLTPERRTEIARLGSAKRWGKKKAQEPTNKSMSWHNTPPGIESECAYYLGGEYFLEDSKVALVAIIDAKWAVCQCGDCKPFVTLLEKLKK